MAVDSETVRQMARLARLQIADHELESLATEMDSILNFMGEIAQWEGEEGHAERPAIRRQDVVHDASSPALIEAAAEHDDGQVVVPPIKGAS